MRVIIGMATIEGREDHCSLAVKSLIDNVDYLLLHKNGAYGEGLTDNGKFRIIDHVNEPCYVFLCDDDILYPHDYIKHTIEQIEKYNCIVTYHGRKLLGKGRNYYKGHKGYGCLRTVSEDLEIDVCGTGVTAFRTDYFLPKGLSESKDKMMSDLVFSLEAAKQGKKIMLLKHEQGWIKDLSAPKETSIYYNHVDKCHRQNEIADEIWLIRK